MDIGGIYDILWSPISDDNKLLERKIKKKNVKMSVDGDKTVSAASNLIFVMSLFWIMGLTDSS